MQDDTRKEPEDFAALANIHEKDPARPMTDAERYLIAKGDPLSLVLARKWLVKPEDLDLLNAMKGKNVSYTVCTENLCRILDSVSHWDIFGRFSYDDFTNVVMYFDPATRERRPLEDA